MFLGCNIYGVSPTETPVFAQKRAFAAQYGVLFAAYALHTRLDIVCIWLWRSALRLHTQNCPINEPQSVCWISREFWGVMFANIVIAGLVFASRMQAAIPSSEQTKK